MTPFSFDHFKKYKHKSKKTKDAELDKFRHVVASVLPDGTVIVVKRAQFILGVATTLTKIRATDIMQITKDSNTELSSVGYGEHGLMLSFFANVGGPITK